MQYPPPPGWFPPGQGFPPPGPGPWNNYQFPGPGGPPGGPPGAAPGPNDRQAQNNQAPIGASNAAERKSVTPAQQTQPPPQPKSFSQAAGQPAQGKAPPPPVDSKPTAAEVKATAASLSADGAAESGKSVPTGPKGSRPTQILPAVPLPAALIAKQSQPGQAGKPKGPNDQPNSAAATAAALRDATQAAKAAVAVAMAKFDSPAAGQQAGGNAMDNLTKKVNEMRVNATRTGPSNRGGRGGRGPRPAKVEVPETDFDFASANAKFNKQDLVKEAVAGSPLADTPTGSASGVEPAADTEAAAPAAYNKTTSFFDNISSEAKDRADSTGHKLGGREWRGEEQRKNIETFGQGSVDGGYRGGYRGRGRGRGGRGRGYGRGGGGRGGGYRNNGNAQAVAQ